MRSSALVVRFLYLFLAALAWPALADPPARVGRISHLSGQVWFIPSPEGEWSRAQLNYPVTSGNALATDPAARIEVQVGAGAVRIDHDSELIVDRLEDNAIGLRLTHGELSITTRERENLDVLTPQGRVSIRDPGMYRIDSIDGGTVQLTVYRGRATLSGADNSITVGPGRSAALTREGAINYDVAAPRQDDFDAWAAARDARYDRSRSARYLSPAIPGYADLDEYGEWIDAPDYGYVWMPRVTAGWVPYRYGHWAYIPPWGWTWVDDAPWGFAPFHYGRWVFWQDRWVWSPGSIVAQPIYAPALVAFIGDPGWSVGFAFGSAPAVGWFPLGFRDVYRPWFPCSQIFMRNVNVTHVNVSRIDWNRPPSPEGTLRRFPTAATVMPQSAFAAGQAVGRGHVTLRQAPAQVSVVPSPPVAAPASIARPPGSSGNRAGPDLREPRAPIRTPGTFEERQRDFGRPGTAEHGRGPNALATPPGALDNATRDPRGQHGNFAPRGDPGFNRGPNEMQAPGRVYSAPSPPTAAVAPQSMPPQRAQEPGDVQQRRYVPPPADANRAAPAVPRPLPQPVERSQHYQAAPEPPQRSYSAREPMPAPPPVMRAPVAPQPPMAPPPVMHASPPPPMASQQPAFQAPPARMAAPPPSPPANANPQGGGQRRGDGGHPDNAHGQGR